MNKLEKHRNKFEKFGLNGNPFSRHNAKIEDVNFLEKCFIEPPLFSYLVKEGSAAFFAPAGGGKTACRRMVELSCDVGDPPIFTIAYDDFSTVLNKASGKFEYINTGMHVEKILGIGAEKIYRFLIQNVAEKTQCSQIWSGKLY